MTDQDDPKPKVVVEKPARPEQSEPKKSSGSVWLLVSVLGLIVLMLTGGGLGFLFAKYQNRKNEEVAITNWTDDSETVEPESETKNLPNETKPPEPKPPNDSATEPDVPNQVKANSKKQPTKQAGNQKTPNSNKLFGTRMIVDFDAFEELDLGLQPMQTAVGKWEAKEPKRIRLGTNPSTSKRRIAFWDGPNNHLVLTLSDDVYPNGKVKLRLKRTAKDGFPFKFQIACSKDGKTWEPIELPFQPTRKTSDMVIQLKGNPTKIRFTCNGPVATKKMKKWNCGMIIYAANFAARKTK